MASSKKKTAKKTMTVKTKEQVVFRRNKGPTELSETVHHELERIRQRNPQNRLMPIDIVKAASKQNSPLHDYFEWDDGLAAEKFRMMQANMLVRCVVRVVDKGHGKKRIGAYVAMNRVRPGTGDQGGYEPTTAVVRRKSDRQQMIVNAVRKLDTARQEMEGIQELTGASDDIEELMVEHGLVEMLEVG